MATKAVPVLFFKSWSFSRYDDWRKCPLKAKLKHLDKVQEPKAEAMQRGIDIHNMAENYIKGKLRTLPPELKPLKDEFKKLRDLYKKRGSGMIVEDNWAFTKEWTETAWDNWTHCWVRIKLDCAHLVTDSRMVVTDWKSGKPNDYKVREYMEQLELYALAALLLHDWLEEVAPRLAFTDHGVFFDRQQDADEPLVYRRKDLPRLLKAWNGRVAPMMADRKFPPRPSNECRWCFYGQEGKSKKNGPGLCKF